MTLHDQVGLKGPAYDVWIERGKIREFSYAMEAPLPEFLEGPTPVIPPMFLVSAPYTWGYTLERPRGTVFSQINHDLTVSLHAEESFLFHGTPLRVGEKLSAQPSLERVWQKKGGSGGNLTFLTILNEYKDSTGSLRAEQRSTSVTTEAAPGEGAWNPKIPTYEPDYTELETESIFLPIERQRFENLEVGKGPGPIYAPPLSKRDIVRFQGVVGEDDPLHHDPEWASKNNYPSVFALGTHQASLMSAYASFWLSPEFIREYKVRFREVMWPGDRFHYEGIVTDLDDTLRKVTLHLTCQREDRTIVCEAWATFDFSSETIRSSI